MRVTSSMYYQNIDADRNKLNPQLFDVNKQISSGRKIQYAYEGTSTFIETLRLDSELTTLGQVSKSTDSGLKFSTQTDTTLNEFTLTLESFKTKLLYAANGTQSPESLNAIAQELDSMRSHLVNLANTSINGQYLFAGTDLSIKPVNDDGTYNGNDGEMLAFGGSGVQQKYNISGSDLFLGEESDTKRTITTNVQLVDQINGSYVTTSSTIADLVGDADVDGDANPLTSPNTLFYIRGTRHDGSLFKEKISLPAGSSVGELLVKVGEAFGNTGVHNVVNVTLNERGNIVVEDKISGSSKLDFHMVAATDYNAGAGADGIADIGANPIEDLNLLDVKVTSFVKSDFPAYVDELRSYDMHQLDAAGDAMYGLHGDFIQKNGEKATSATLIRDIVSSDVDFIQVGGATLTGTDTMQDLIDTIDAQFGVTASLINGKIAYSDPGAAGAVTLESWSLATGQVKGLPSEGGVSYDASSFALDGSKLTSNIAQIVTSDNSFATEATKLGAVASGTSYDSANDRFIGLDGKSLTLEGTNINGERYEVQIDLLDAGSTVTVNLPAASAVTFDLLDASDNATDAGKVTYRQLLDVVNMVVTDNIPDGTIADYRLQTQQAMTAGDTMLTSDGKLTFQEQSVGITQASISIFDTNASDFSNTDPLDDPSTDNPAFMLFNANNALTVRDPKTDFFARIDEAIAAVRKGELNPDGETDDPRNGGIEHAIKMVDDMMLHVENMHVTAGAQSNALTLMNERTEMLIVSTTTLRSEVIDTDIAEASMRLQQLTLNMQALLSTVSRVSQLSLVNYLR